VIGAYFGGPQGAQIGYAIGSVVGNAVDPLMIDGPKIGDIAQQTSSEGVYQPIYFGTSQGAGNIIAQGPNIIRRRKESQGKGGPVTITESLYKTFAIRIGVSWKGEEGITGISRIWENGKLVFDIRANSTIPAESAEFSTKFRLYTGTDTQLPDPALEAIYGLGNTPSYRGRSYIVFPQYDITQWKAIPQYSFEVVTGGTAVQAIQVVATAHTDSESTADWLSSADGLDFSSPWINSAIIDNRDSWLIANQDRYIAYGNTRVPAYLEVGTNDWQIATGDSVSSVGGQKLAAMDDTGQIILIPGGLNAPLLRSEDGGLSWNHSTPIDLNLILHRGAHFIGYYRFGGGGRLFNSVDGVGWALLGSVSLSAALGLSRWNSVTHGYIGGSSPFPYSPRLLQSVDGLDWGPAPIPALSGSPSYVAAICSGTFAGTYDETCVAMMDDGQIIYKQTAFGGWHTSPDNMGCTPRQITFNGVRFSAIGYTGGSPNIGIIKTSEDGITWTTRRTETIGFSESWNCIQSLAASGGEISDVPPMLDEVISTIHTFCHQPANEYDVTELADIPVRGMILAGGYSGADCIRTLQSLWMIDSPEYDKKIHYRLRGKPIERLFTFDDLVDEPEEATREQAIEYPAKLHLDYQNPGVDYAPAKATSSRSSIDARVLGEANVQIPVVLTPNEAAQRAMVLHKVSWSDTDGEVIFTVPDNNIDLVPGHCIGLSLRDTIRRLRIDKLEYASGQIRLTCRNDRQSAYTSNVEGIDPPPPTPPPPSIVGPTQIIIGDYPALRDQDDISTLVKYVAMGGISPAWRGALGQYSTDGGSSYTDMLDVSQGAIMGTLQDDMTAASPYYPDTTNKIVVQLDISDGSIEIDSLTESQWLNEGGGFAIHNSDGTFEIGQFRDADDLGEGLYEISHLMRGRYNTEASEHLAGARFVLLDTISAVAAPVSHIDLDIYHRAISYGNTPESGTIVNDVFHGNSQIEWPVANVLLERAGSVVEATVIPRNRFGTEMNPIRSINWQGYHWQVTDGSNSIDRIGTSTDESFDVSGWSSPVQVAVSQINRLTGDGPSVTEEIA
jgi:hypothetical protein